MNQTVVEFCNKHNACIKGKQWAIDTGCETMAEVWERKDFRYGWRIWVATRQGVFTEKEMQVFTCWCVRQVWDLLEDERSKRAVEVAERYIEGKATVEEMKKARGEASEAWKAAGAAARAAARAAIKAVEEAAKAAGAAWAATETAAATWETGAAWAAWWVAEARQGEEEKQVKYLIELGNPFNR